MVWIEVYGVPSDCWCKDFFKKLGGQVGELVCVDDDTDSRTRLDKARILILAPLDSKIPSEVTVKGGFREFKVRLKEDPQQVSIEWVNHFLGLHPPLKMDAFPRSKCAEISNERDGEEREVSEDGKLQAGKRTERLDEFVIIREKAISNKLPLQNIPSVRKGTRKKQVSSEYLPTTSLAIGCSKAVGGERGMMDKGKGRKIYKLYPKSMWFPMCKSGVRIGVDRKGRKSQRLEVESSSSGSGFIPSKGPIFFVGENSKVMEVDSLSPNNISLESGEPSPIIKSPARIGGSYVIGNGTSLMSDKSQSKDQSQLLGSLETHDSFVAETQITSQGKIVGQGINLCIDLRGPKPGNLGREDCNEDQREMVGAVNRKKNQREKKKKGNGLDSRVKSHPMKTRISKPAYQSDPKRRCKEVIWNLDEEITKVYEKGAELGIDFKAKTCHGFTEGGDGNGNNRRWDLEAEVKKVIDTGVALGIDFNGREAEVMLYLSSREQEDEDRLNE
ncbi:hypothetical protein Q3G72_010629 [Acer saccharum]|nr:hypothetical protein Q3G72_010629 [Acer saccharum]